MIMSKEKNQLILIVVEKESVRLENKYGWLSWKEGGRRSLKNDRPPLDGTN